MGNFCSLIIKDLGFGYKITNKNAKTVKKAQEI